MIILDLTRLKPNSGIRVRLRWEGGFVNGKKKKNGVKEREK